MKGCFFLDKLNTFFKNCFFKNLHNWNAVPSALRIYTYKFLGYSAFIFVVAVFSGVALTSLSIALVGFIISAVLLVYALYLLLHFRSSEILSITGKCVQIERQGWRKQYVCVYFVDSNNRLYSYITNANSMTLRWKGGIQPGTMITIYPINAFSIIKDEDTYINNKYYLVKKKIA